MNRVYKVIWSKVKGCYVVASELAKGHTKSASSKRTAKRKTAEVAMVIGTVTTILTSQVAPVMAVFSSGQNAVNTVTTSSTENGTSVAGGKIDSTRAGGVTDSNTLSIGMSSWASGKGSVAIGGAQSDNYEAVGMGYNARAAGYQAVSLGGESSATGIGAIAIGANTSASLAASLALGSGSVTNTLGGMSTYTINGISYTFAGGTPIGTLSIGDSVTGKTRTITNLAAGAISATSTEAINGSQLYAVTTELNKVASTASTAASTATATSTSLNTVSTSLNNVSTSVVANSTAISNLKTSTAAISTSLSNVSTSVSAVSSALSTTNVSVANLSTSVAANSTAISNLKTSTTAISTSVNTVSTALDTTNTAVSNMSTAVSNVSTSVNNVSTALDQTNNRIDVLSTSAMGSKTEVQAASGNLTVTSTVNANGVNVYTVDLAKDVTVNSLSATGATGNTTVVNGEGITIHNTTNNSTVSLTSSGLNNGGNRITNIADGIENTDAASVGQLKAVEGSIGNMANTIDAVGAQSAAISALKPLAYDPQEPTQIMAGIGYYGGKGAVALGVAHYTNDSTMIHAGASMGSSGSKIMANAGVSWKFGSSDSKARAIYSGSATTIALQNKVNTLELENKAQKAVNMAQKAQLDSQNARIEQLEAKLNTLLSKM